MSTLFYTERATSLPEQRYFFASLHDWCKTNIQRNTVSVHRRLSETSVQGMAYVLTRTLSKNTISCSDDVGRALTSLSQTCKLAALTIDYIIQGKLTDFTGQPMRITEVAQRIKAQSQLYSHADYEAVWMLIAPPDSRTGDWTSYVSSDAAKLVCQHAISPHAIYASVKDDVLMAPGALLRYYVYQSLLDHPAQFFRLVSDTELVTTSAAMAERRRGLLRVAAAAHAIANIPLLIKLRLIESTFSRLSQAIGPLPLSKRDELDIEAVSKHTQRIDVFPTKQIADRICAWADDSADGNLLGMYREPIETLTHEALSVEDFNQYPLVDSKGTPRPAGPEMQTRNLVDFYDRVDKYTEKNFKELARSVPTVDAVQAEFLANSLVELSAFRITAAQRFLMTGLPMVPLRPRYNVNRVMMLVSKYINAYTTTCTQLDGHHEAYITAQDATELPRLFNFDPYLVADPNPWLARIDRQNGPNMNQATSGKPLFMSQEFLDFAMTPAVTRDMTELELPLVADAKIVRTAFTANTTVNSVAWWDGELRSKILELIPDAGPTLLPVQAFPSSQGVRHSRLINTTTFGASAKEVVDAQLSDTVRDYVVRATGLSGKYLAIALAVEGTRRRLATLLGSFCTVYVRRLDAGEASNKAEVFDVKNYDQVIGEGVPYGLTGANFSPDKDIQPEDSYAQLATLCHDQFVPIVSHLVYVRLIRFMPLAVEPINSRTPIKLAETSDNPFYAASLSIGRRYVGHRRVAPITTEEKKLQEILYFVEAPALIHLSLQGALDRFGRPPRMLLSRTHAYTLRTTAVLAETSPKTSEPMNSSVDRYTTWSGIALDRLALHGETTKVISGSSDSSGVETAMAEAIKLTAAADAQVKDSLAVAATPVEQAVPTENLVKQTAAKNIKTGKSDLPTA